MLVKNYQEVLEQSGYIKNNRDCWWPKYIQERDQTVEMARRIFTIDEVYNHPAFYKEYSIDGNYLSLRLL